MSGQDDPDTSYDEMVQFANLPSTKENEDLDVDELEGDSNDDYLDDEHPPIQSIIGPDGLREFIMLPLWMINNFNSSIK